MQHQMTNEELIEFVNENPESDDVTLELCIRLQFAMDEMARLVRREGGGDGNHT